MSYYQTSTLNCFYKYTYISEKEYKYNYTITLVK